MSAAILPFRAAPSELHRSSPSSPQVASGPDTEIRPGRWRTLIGKFRSGLFFPEIEAQRRTLAPGLPHHRHPMTVDEACAGIVLVSVLGLCCLYLLVRVLHG